MNKQAFLDGVENGLASAAMWGGNTAKKGLNAVRGLHPYLEQSLTNPATWKEKLHDDKFNEEFLKPTLKKLFSHNTVAGLTGGGIGAATGAVASKKKERWSGALKGGLFGSAVGLGGSVALPEVSKQFTSGLLSAVRRPVGRVVSNLVYPRSYETGGYEGEDVVNAKTKWEAIFGKHKVKQLVDAIKKDKPIYKFDTERDMQDAKFNQAREYIFRKSFDLEPHKGMEFVKDYFRTNSKGQLEYNRANPAMASTVANVDSMAMNALMGRLLKTNGNSSGLGNDSGGVMGSFMPRYNIVDDTVDVADPWDFALHPGEKLDNMSNLSRFFIDKLMNKQTMSHRIYDAAKKMRERVPIFDQLVQQTQQKGQEYL